MSLSRKMIDKTADKFTSIKIARFLMKVVGFWIADTESEKKLQNALRRYTVFAIAMALWVVVCDFYYSMGDFYALTYTACSAMPVVLVLVKVCTYIYHRERIMNTLRFTGNHFWYATYDEFGTKILEDTEKKGLIVISMFTFFVHGTVISYMLAPIIENIRRNGSDRILPFNIWLGVPLKESPNFEIAFVCEIIALIHSGLCFCCFDNLLGLLNIHAAAQFRILGHRLQEMFRKEYSKSSDLRDEEISTEFRECIDQHRMLIAYMDNIEYMFTYATLCQLLISGVMLCVAGFQVFLAQGTLVQRLIFIAHTNGTFFQLFVTTWTANEVIVESQEFGVAAYNADWECGFSETNKKIRVGIALMLVRSSKPCRITAGGFFPVSLETFTTVLSTAASYFALLRKVDTDLER